MAPLREKIGDTFNKLSDRLHKRPASEDGESSQWYKQLKRTPNSPPKSGPFPVPLTFLGANPLGPSPPFHTSKPSELLPPGSKPTSSQSSSSYLSCQPGSSLGNPIDLTDHSPPNHTSSASTLSSLAISADEMDGSEGGKPAQSKESGRASRSRRTLITPMNLFIERNFGTADILGTSPTINDANLPMFGNYLKKLQCNDPQCRAPIFITQAQLVARVKMGFGTKGGQGLLHSFLRCGKCNTFSCAGMHCMRHLKTLDLQQIQTVSGRPGQKFAWCCDAGRQLLILALACGPEPIVDDKPRSEPKAHQNAAKATKPTAPKPTSAKKASKSKAPSHAQVSMLSQGTGYGGPSSLSGIQQALAHGATSLAKITGPPKKSVISQADQELEKYLFALSQVLPSPLRGEAVPSFDDRSHTRTAEMLAKSPLLPRVSEVLRRSSIDDMGSQHQLYFSLLQFLFALSRHADLRRILFAPQTLFPESQQVAAAAFGMGIGPSNAAYDTTQSLYELLKELDKLCRHFSERAHRHRGQVEDTDETRPLAVAEQVRATVDTLQLLRIRDFSVGSLDGTLTKNLGSGLLPNVLTRSRAAKMSATDGNAQEGDVMAAWHRQHCVEEVPDEKIMGGFSYASQAQAVTEKASEKGRMKSLVTQLAGLGSNLPQGIYVRHGISRLDVIKVLIMGPKGTPYENGVFEFDLFCDEKFPTRPPHMRFRTNGGGTVEFNPNLYANGKVCLSLLGTWSGQGWEPHRSTILQILVSVQGMIFNATPWYNEPGREFNIDGQRSDLYNKAIWGQTIRHATLYWLKARLARPASSSKGKDPVRNVPQAQPVTAPAAESAPQAATNTAKAVHIQTGHSGTNQYQYDFSDWSMPLPVPDWAMNTMLGHMAVQQWETSQHAGQHAGQSSSKFAPLPQTAALPQALDGSQPGPSNAPHSAANPTYHPSLPALWNTDQPSGVPTLGKFQQEFGAPINDEVSYEVWGHDPQALAMSQNHMYALAVATQGMPSLPAHYTHYQPGPSHPPIPPPESPAAPVQDDALWGETLRAYFSAMATEIVDTATASPYGTDPAILSLVKEALLAHRFM